jgi:hypothetical protein
LSIFTRFRRQPTQGLTTAEDDAVPTNTVPTNTVPTDAMPREDVAGEDVPSEDAAGDPAGKLRQGRRVAAWVGTGLACLLVLFALIAPNRISQLTAAAFVRIPVEGLVGVALFLVLPARARRVVAALVGTALGLLTIAKIIDMGFYEVLDRPFDPVLDWPLLADAVEFLRRSYGQAGAIGSVVVAVAITVAVLVLMTLSVLRLTRIVARHRTTTIRTVVVLVVVWVTCAVLGVRIVPGVPLAADSAAALAYGRALQVRAGLRDRQAFAAEAAVDAFRNTPGDELLTALRGKDVILTFVESYGRVAVEDPEFAPQVGAVLDAGNRRLRAAGFASRSAFLTSPTFGGGSWLAHSTLLSGLWIDNQQRYRNLLASDRLTLNGAFRRADWRTVGVEPAVSRPWPEGAFYGYNQLYTAQNLGYRGPLFTFGSIPDQYTLSAFQRSERAAPSHAPTMAEIVLLSSHGPWAPLPRLIGWDNVGDGSAFDGMPATGDSPDVVSRDRTRIRAAYRQSIEYSLNTLISYVETYGDDNLVLVFLGDHQPAPIVAGEGASRDVPITIVARDRAVLDRISGWGWQDGLKPDPRAPVWRMDTFRDRFLTAFGPQARPTPSPSPPTR